MIRNQAGQTVNCEVIGLAGAPFTGTVTVYVTIDAGAQVIGSVGSGLATLKGNGLYQYLPAQAETNGADVEYTFIGSGAAPASKQFATLTLAQAQALQAATGPGVLTGRDLVTDALLEINVYDALDEPSPQDAAFVLRKLNRILDNWNAERPGVYAEQFQSYTLTPALSPHTIGPSGTFVVTQRPVTVEGATLVLNTANSPQVGIRLRDRGWYQSLSIPSLSTQMPTDLYYEPAWPNGNLYFYPVPSAAYHVILWTRIVLASLGLNDAFTLPPGYQDAITLTLAEDIAPTFEKPVAPSLARKAMEARARIFSNNIEIPLLSTQDSGMPTSGGGGGRGNKTYYTGWWTT